MNIDIKLKDIIEAKDKESFDSFCDTINFYVENGFYYRVSLIKEIYDGLKKGDISIAGNYSVSEICNIVESKRVECISKCLFPEHTIIMYPKKKELRSKYNRVCDFTGQQIKRNSYYINYGFFLEDLTARKSYVLNKSLNVALECDDMLPKNVVELEAFDFRLSHSYTNQDEKFYNISSCLKNSEIKLRRLNKKNK